MEFHLNDLALASVTYSHFTKGFHYASSGTQGNFFAAVAGLSHGRFTTEVIEEFDA